MHHQNIIVVGALPLVDEEGRERKEDITYPQHIHEVWDHGYVREESQDRTMDRFCGHSRHW